MCASPGTCAYAARQTEVAHTAEEHVDYLYKRRNKGGLGGGVIWVCMPICVDVRARRAAKREHVQRGWRAHAQNVVLVLAAAVGFGG